MFHHLGLSFCDSVSHSCVQYVSNRILYRFVSSEETEDLVDASLLSVG